METRFGFVTVAPSFPPILKRLDDITRDYVAALSAMGGERWDVDQLTDPRPLLMLVATGGSEQVVLDLVETRWAAVPGEPVFLIAHPGNNSLPASLEVLARLQQDGAQGRIFYLKGPEDRAGLAQIERAVAGLAVQRALRSTRIGLIGDPSDWLVASMPDADVVEAAWGPDVVPIPLSELEARIEAIPASAVTETVASLVAEASAVEEPSQAELTDVARVHAALRQLVDEHDLDAITVRCFDLVLDLQTTGCVGLAELTDAGVIAACEGDLVTTVGLIWAHHLVGETPWMANPAQIDEAKNSVWLAHCTVPRGMVEDYRLRSHFESGLGVGIQGSLPQEPVTLFRIGGVGMDRLWVAEGEITAVGDAENLCRTQAEVQLTRGHVTDLLRAPLGNHVVLVPGHHADRLQGWWSSASFPNPKRS